MSMMEEKDLKQRNNLETSDDAADFGLNSDENIAGTSHLNEPVNHDNDELEKLVAELAEQKDKYLRLMAEFDNYRRRTAKEKIELMQTAGKDVIIPLLEVLDDCDRAEKQMETSEDLPLIKEGSKLIFNKLRNTLKSQGVKEMETLHQEFDLEKEEAITEIPAPTKDLKGKVVDEIQKGYYLNDKIIRFAKVVVGK